MAVGIIGAMDEEVSALIDELEQAKCTTIAGLRFCEGKLNKQSVVVVRCGIGKVNAALCTQLLIDQFSVEAVINTGVAGGIDEQVEIGDVVLSTCAVQHDFDTHAFGYDPGVIPRMERSSFPADQRMLTAAYDISQAVLGQQRVHQGIVASGDQFVASKQHKERISRCFSAACAEMEGAAIAHVCWVNQVPYLIIRAISDKADTSAPDNFQEFVAEIVPALNQIVGKLIYSLCSA